MPVTEQSEVLINQVEREIHLATVIMRSKRFTSGTVLTSRGGSSWVLPPGTSTNLRSPMMSISSLDVLIDSLVESFPGVLRVPIPSIVRIAGAGHKFLHKPSHSISYRTDLIVSS